MNIILKILFFIFGIIFFSMIISIIINRRRIKVTNYFVKNKKIPKEFDNYRILQLSDLHTHQFGENNERLILKINQINPDIIVMTGDMLDCLSKKANVLYDLSNELVKKYNVYYIIGNHEERYRKSKLEKIKKSLMYIGVNVLDNRKIVLEKNNSKINVYGIWIELKYYLSKKIRRRKKINFTEDDIKNKIGNLNKTEFNILLVHTPVYMNAYLNWGADLILSGHMHGGIMYIPKIGGLLSPERVFFPKYSGGMYTKIIKDNKSDLIVSKGLGFGRIPYRIYNPPEIIVITLKS